jgi:hypothetical protein
MTTAPPRLLRTGRHPYEVAALAASIGIGVVGLFVGLPPTPGIARVIWLLTMIAGGVIALVGIHRTTRYGISGLVVEQAGLVPLIVATGAYVGGMLAYGPQETWLDACLFAAITCAHCARAWHIHVDIVHHHRITGRRA